MCSALTHDLTTAEILYFMPDYKEILQTYIWQDYDNPPEFPRLRKFLRFWETELEGPLYKIRVAHKKIITPTEFKFLDGEFKM